MTSDATPTPSRAEDQLELFELGQQGRPRAALRSPGGLTLWLRFEQLILIGIAALIGLTVVFAFGVERGKHLVRSERLLIEPHALGRPAIPSSTEAVQTSAPVPSTPSVRPIEERQDQDHDAPDQQHGPARVAQGRDGYAIQVVTYERAALAKEELDRLQSSGEPAFLRIGDAYTVLYVGPFHTKATAKAKLPDLKTRYGDCFLKTL